MKWFMATNQKSLFNDQFYDQIIVAVVSASRFTSLDPYIAYDGLDNERLEYLRRIGVKVIFHELSFKADVESYIVENYPYDDSEKRKMIDRRTGAFLRSEIPGLVIEEGIEDEYILYTDCDVVFAKELNLSKYKPRFFAACGSREGGYTRFKIGGWMHFNSGVMLMNVHNMYVKMNKFIDYSK